MKKVKNFQMKLNKHRRGLIKKVQEKTRLGTKSRAITRALELFLIYRSYFEDKYGEFE